MRLSYILARIATRLGVALWRHRFAMLVAAISVGALGVYEMTYAGPAAVNGDCADMTMAAVTKVDDEMAHAAYACLGPTMRNTTEDAFVAGMHDRQLPQGSISRVGDQRLKNGGRIVFYTVEQQSQSVGYIIYLDPTGKVIRVE